MSATKKDPSSLLGQQVRARTYESPDYDETRELTGELARRWLPIWHDWQWFVGGLVADPDTVEKL